MKKNNKIAYYAKDKKRITKYINLMEKELEELKSSINQNDPNPYIISGRLIRMTDILSITSRLFLTKYNKQLK